MRNNINGHTWSDLYEFVYTFDAEGGNLLPHYQDIKSTGNQLVERIGCAIWDASTENIGTTTINIGSEVFSVQVRRESPNEKQLSAGEAMAGINSAVKPKPASRDAMDVLEDEKELRGSEVAAEISVAEEEKLGVGKSIIERLEAINCRVDTTRRWVLMADNLSMYDIDEITEDDLQAWERSYAYWQKKGKELLKK